MIIEYVHRALGRGKRSVNVLREEFSCSGGIESENVLYFIHNINNKYIYVYIYVFIPTYECVYIWPSTSCHDDDELRLGNGRAANQICGRSTLLESLASALAVLVRLLYYCIYNNRYIHVYLHWLHLHFNIITSGAGLLFLS